MLVLHIGLPKTGTTYLQKTILPRAPELMLVHRLQGPEQSAVCFDLRRYVRANAVLAALLRLRIRHRLAGFLAQAGAERRALLVSAENISVHSIDFWRNADPPPDRVAARLAALAGPGSALAPVRVVIGLRGQDQWLASRYAESGKDLPGLCQQDFDRRLAEIAASQSLPGALAWLDHCRVYTSFADALGAENVHVFRSERMAEEPAKSLARLGRFIAGEPLAAALRRLGRRKRSVRRNVLSIGENVWRLRGDGSELRLTPELQEVVKARFRELNRALGAILTRREAAPGFSC